MKHIIRTLLGLLLLASPAAQGHFVFITNSDDTITIIADPGASGSLDIPATLTGLRVTGIGEFAFDSTNLTNMTIPESVIQIGVGAFSACAKLTNIAVAAQNPVFSSTNGVLFDGVDEVIVAYPPDLPGGYAIPGGIVVVAPWAFALSSGLTSITIPGSVAVIGDNAFLSCTNLTNILFQGNAPVVGASVFAGDTNATIYYMPGTSGWKPKLDGIPTAMLNPPPQAGALQVTILPAAAARSGAQWQVDGGTPQPSGAIVLGLTAGNHTVTFNEGKDWAPPASQTISVSASMTNMGSGTYSELGSLQVTMAPAAAVKSGATWQVDGGAPQPSGAIVNNLATGSHAVTFGAIDGWTTPANQTVIVRTGITSHARGAYIFSSAGTYNGLFFADSGVTEETAGMVRGLAVTPQGTYSGRLLIAGQSYSLTGTFGAGNEASNYIARATRLGGPLAVQMTLHAEAVPPDITGTVVGTNWTASLTNYLTTVGGSAAYTLLLTSYGSPPGYGYLLVTDHAGHLTISGALADGAMVAQSVPISASGFVPIYTSLYNNTGLLLGWIELASNSASGNVTWIKKASRSALYPGGFTNVLSVNGSPWIAPMPGSGAINLTNGTLDVSGGNLSTPLEFAVALGNKNALTKLAGSPTNSLTGSINARTGLLTVTFGNGTGRVTTTGKGAILQNLNSGGGFFLGKTNAGTILLQP